jgi:GTP-binding protein
VPRRQFADEAQITVRAGKGGAGCVSFARRRFQPVGAADGGDGGRGGDVKLVASASTQTLAQFRHRRLFRAANGQPGAGNLKTGAQGADLIITVPVGTIVRDADQGQVLADLVTAGQEVIVARGGRGGKGNAHFSSSRLRSPRFAQPGEPGEERRLSLELQILADVGLIGLPNAGKTTLLTRLTASKALPSAYPFSTLEPNLGVLPHEVRPPLILADIPGLVAGAAAGKGLGQRFLRHLHRTRLLLHVVDSTQLDPDRPLAPIDVVLEELRLFEPGLLHRPHVVVFNKIDLLPGGFPWGRILAACEARGWPAVAVSAQTGEGLAALQDLLWNQIDALPHADIG